MANGVEHLFVFNMKFAICLSSFLVKCLIVSFAHFLIGLIGVFSFLSFFFAIDFESSSCVLYSCPFSDM